MKTVRRPPYPKWNPGYFPCSSLTPLPLSSSRPSVDSGLKGLFAGYLTVEWRSEYPPFVAQGIPEINDLNVLPQFRRRGIATALIKEAEQCIGERSFVVGIGVGMTPDYGAAQRLYAVLQYVPDGRGVYDCDRHAQPGDEVKVDNLVQYLTKTLR